jgi:methionine sulfoxide reductase heme-binding subunit
MGSTARWSKGLAIFGIAVVALFLGFLLTTLLFVPSGGSGHGGTTSMGGNTTSMGGHGGSLAAGGNTTHGGNMSMAGNRPVGGVRLPPFFRSFAFVGLVLSGSYLTALAVWAGLRDQWHVWGRHVVTAAAMFLLVVLYLNAKGGFAYNQHSWNQAFADTSVVLFAATLAIGPLGRLWRPASRASPWRRETGIWGTFAALMHVGIYWEAAVGWSRWRLFFYPEGQGGIADTLAGDRAKGLVPTAFHVANAIGVVALAYALVLAVTSNDACQRWLKAGWSWLQDRATTMWLVALLHVWVFAYFVGAGLILPVGTLWASFWMVLLLQTAAFGKTVWLRRVGRPGPPTGAGSMVRSESATAP